MRPFLARNLLALRYINSNLPLARITSLRQVPYPSFVMAASPTARGKRAASSSVSPSKRVVKATKTSGQDRVNGAATDVKNVDVDDYADEPDFDADALIEAAAQAEEEDMRSRASQSSQASIKARSTSSQMSAKNGPTSSMSSAKSHPSPGRPSADMKKPSTTISAPVQGDDGLFKLPADAHLLKHDDASLERKTMDPEWYSRLESEIEAPYFASLKAYLKRELASGKQIFPPAHLVHSWSRLTPLRNVKVVIVGQDPYHNVGQACGHSFSVPKGVQVPGSLQNIYKELSQEYGAAFKRPNHGCLDGWAKQGVLLLNACLTVTAHQAGSHHNQGWETFTQCVLRAIAGNASHAQKPSVKTSTIASMFSKASAPSSGPTTTKAQPSTAAAETQVNGQEVKTGNESHGANKDASPSKGVVFLAWGLPAQKTLAAAGITDKTANVLLLKSPHPSPLSAHRGFLGNGHFKKANEWLESPARYGPNGGIQWGSL